MRLERFATECDYLSAAMLDAGAGLADLPPAPGITSLCAVLMQLKAVLDGIPADDRNADGSVLFSKERLRETILLQREAMRLVANMLVLTPPMADTNGVLTWIAAHRMKLAAADILVRLSEMEVSP